MLAAWMFGNSRRPVRDAFFTLSAPFVSLLAMALGVEVPLQPSQDEDGQLPVVVIVLVLVLWIAGLCTWASIPATLDVRADQRWWQPERGTALTRIAGRERFGRRLGRLADESPTRTVLRPRSASRGSWRADAGK